MKLKKKKIDRKHLIHTFLFALFCIFGLSVAYAALSTTLNISGSAEVVSSTFGIKVEKVSVNDLKNSSYFDSCSLYNCDGNVISKGYASMDSVPVVTNTSISNFKFSVSVPGDTIGVFYKITNVGSIPVVLNNIESEGFEVKSLINSQTDVEWATNNVDYEGWFEFVSDGREFGTSDILCPNDSLFYVIGLQIPEEVTTIPSGEIEISSAGVTYEFLQTDQYLCES